jgi:hypothetical protein
VLEKKPSDQSALYHLVLALRKKGEPAEIPDLLKRLAKARQDAARQEGERNRYKLVVAPSELSRRPLAQLRKPLLRPTRL